MRKWLRDGLLLIFGIVFSGFVFSYHYTKVYSDEMSRVSNTIPIAVVIPSPEDIAPTKEVPVVELTLSKETSRVTEAPSTPAISEDKSSSNLSIPESCICISNTTQQRHNFCYVDPQNSSSIGAKFDCQSVGYLEHLGLLQKPASVVNLSEPTRKAEEVVFVSAFSDNHYYEGHNSYLSIRRFYPEQKYILYGLNLNKILLRVFENDKNVEFRQFNVSKYPSYASNWMEYRFKPLIIAEVLLEYSNIWWIDAHVTFSAPNITTDTYQEIAERRNNHTNPLLSPIIFFIHSSHSNFAVLNPLLLGYFPTNSMVLLKDETHGGQLGANVFYLARTEFTMKIIKWWVLCALDYMCMNPTGAQVGCSFNLNRNEFYANCFRFDQSVINLLLLNQLQDYRTFHGSVGYKFNH